MGPLLPYVAIGYLAAGFVAGGLFFATISAWVWRAAVRSAHVNLARKCVHRGKDEWAMHIRASLAIFEEAWMREDRPHERHAED